MHQITLRNLLKAYRERLRSERSNVKRCILCEKKKTIFTLKICVVSILAIFYC